MRNEERAERTDFEKAFKDAIDQLDSVGQSLRKAVVVSIGDGNVVVDLGLKSEVTISAREFGDQIESLSVGDTVEVYVESVENSSGETVASYARARCERIADEFCASIGTDTVFEGSVYSKVRGGYVINLCGISAFLPFSQVDSFITNMPGFVGSTQKFKVMSVDRGKGGVVVMHQKAGDGEEGGFFEGSIIEGTVKNLTDYGAFIDMGGVDGLLHVTDIAWYHVQSPSDVLSAGQKVKVQIIRINKETGRISLGMKQLEEDPWLDVERRVVIGDVRAVEVMHVQDYGVFVLIDSNIEGFIHVKELSWSLGRQAKAANLVKVGDKFDARVIDIDRQKRRFTMSKRQVEENPWKLFADKYPEGTVVSVKVLDKQEQGLLVEGPDGAEGFVDISEIDWVAEKPMDVVEVGKSYQARVLSVDLYGDGVVFSIKASVASPAQEYCKKIRKGSVVTCTVDKVVDAGVFVVLKEGVRGFIRRTDLAKDRGVHTTKRCAPGETIEASFCSYNRKNDLLQLSVRHKEMQEEQEVMEQYGSVSSGASLREILGGDAEADIFSEDGASEEE